MVSNLTVREIKIEDIKLIVNYWLNSDTEFLSKIGVDLAKLPTEENLTNMLTEQINTKLENKKSYALIWELEGKPIGHSNINGIKLGKEATMHLHIWKSNIRQKGIGTELVKLSLPYYFEKFNLEKIICEPYALNPAPNKTISKIGFQFISTYKTIPGTLNFEQEVNRWELTRSNVKILNKNHNRLNS